MAKAARKKNWFAIGVTSAVVVVIVAVAATVIGMNMVQSSPGTQPSGSAINADTGAITVPASATASPSATGSPTVVDEYIDFQCPICKQLEASYGPSFKALADSGDITLQVHPISILNRVTANASADQKNYSSRGAAAAYCVAASNPSAFSPFLTTLFANQPDETSGTGLTNAQLATFATQAGAPDAASCINDGSYVKYVDYMTKKTPLSPGQSSIGTPTFAVNGKTISLQSLPQDPSQLGAFLTSQK